MDTAHPPPCLSILGFLGYSDDPGIIPGWMDTALPPPPPLSEYPGIPGILGRSWDHPGMDGHSSTPPPPPCLSILGFLGYSDDPRIIPGWMDTALPPPCLSILGFLGYSDDPGIIPGWTQLIPPPPPLSEYPGIPGILGRSEDHSGMDAPHPPCLSILGFLGYSDDPRIIPGWTQSLRCPSILRLVVRVGVWYICTKCGNISFLINQLDFNCCKQ